MLNTQSRAPYKALLEFLDEEALDFGYTGYYTAYPVNFLSNKRIVLSPRAGPVVTERYAPYSRKVEKADRVCYIFRSQSRTDQAFREQLNALQALYTRRETGDWNVCYGVDSRVRASIGLPVHTAE